MALSSPFSLSDILSQFPDADPSKVSARVTASGGETSSASVKLSVSAEDGAITSSAIAVAEVDDQKVETTASAEAAGETASTLLDLEASIQEQDGQIVAENSANSEAEAEAEEGGMATATASTDAEATGFDSVDITQSPAGGQVTDSGWEVTQTGENPTATSTTELEAIGIQSVEIETLELPLEDEGLAGSWMFLDLS